ncbi:MAG: nuclear transport factor 2 family protein [Chloroflexi bacterium]|nr:nuclear transport factor 2 family protein [Chloroflexota bacterium]
MTPAQIGYAEAADFLARYAAALTTFDGDDWVALFSEDAEYHADPFSAPVVGHNGLRALLLERAAREAQSEFEIQRHWVSGATILSAWHASAVDRGSRQRVRSAGFSTFEMQDGRCARYRQWWHRRGEG